MDGVVGLMAELVEFPPHPGCDSLLGDVIEFRWQTADENGNFQNFTALACVKCYKIDHVIE